MLVDDDAAVFGVDACRDGEPAVGAHPGGRHNELCLNDFTGVQSDGAILDGGHARRPDEANADVGQHLRHTFADLETEPAQHGHGLRRDERGGDTAGCEAGRRLAPDQTAAGHNGRVGVLGRHP